MSAGERIRVLHVACDLGVGGTERALQHLAEALDRGSFDVRAAAFDRDGPRGALLRAAGVPVEAFGCDVAKLAAYIRDERIDAVHAHLPGYPEERPVAILDALGRAAPPVVVETNVFGVHHAGATRDFLALRLVPSKTALLRFAQKLGAALGPGFFERHGVLYNPLDVERIEALRRDLEPRRDEVRARLGLRPGDFAIVRVARPDDGKWDPILSVGFARLAARVPEARLVLQAAAPRGKEELAAAGLSSRCLYLDVTADERTLGETYVAADACVNASPIGESFGYAIAEGFAYGRPSVATATPRRANAQAELIDSGRSGYIVATAAGLARALEDLARNPARRAAFADAGRAVVRRCFDARVLAKDLEVRYARLLAARGIALPAPLRERLAETTSPAPSVAELAAYPAEYRGRLSNVFGGLGLRGRIEAWKASLKARRLGRAFARAARP